MCSVKDYKFVFQRTPNPCCFHQEPSLCSQFSFAPDSLIAPAATAGCWHSLFSCPSTSHFFILSLAPCSPTVPHNIFYMQTRVQRSIAMTAAPQWALPSMWMWALNFWKNVLKRTGRGQLEEEKESEGERKSNEKWDKTIGNAFRLTSPPFPTVVIHLGGSSVHSLS